MAKRLIRGTFEVEMKCPGCNAQILDIVDGKCPACGAVVNVIPWWERPSNAEDATSDEYSSEELVDNPAVGVGRYLTIGSYAVLISIPFVSEILTVVEHRSLDVLGVTWLILNSVLGYATFQGIRWTRFGAGVINGLLVLPFASMLAELTAQPHEGPREVWAYVRGLFAIGMIVALGVPSTVLMFSTSVSLFIETRARRTQ